MCGIAGFFNLAEQSVPRDAQEIAAKQIRTLRYRGPDAAGIHVGPGVALAHARLSIIDISTSANQPMSDEAGDVTLVFNGEIYNFQELQTELRSLGHRFHTNSDTEVLVEGYRAWGIDVVQRLRGMFAVALYDKTRDRLLLFRDRVGKKPLHYTITGQMLVFASEIKGILSYPGVPRSADLDAIHEYLTFQYVPSPMTAFAGIFKLPPAHLAVVERGKPLRIERYYHFPVPDKFRPRPIAQLQDELVDQLKEATRLRMIADVPIGAFLSGGVDSSAVVAMMAVQSQEPVRTFTIGFQEEQYDERPYARMVAERYKTEHHEMMVRPDAMSVIDTLVYHYGEPYADSSAIPTYYVSKIAREHVTVILSGDGGDENFLGYTRYLSCRKLGERSRLPIPMQKKLRKLLAHLPAGDNSGATLRRVRRAAERMCEPQSRRYEPFVTYFSDASKQDLYAGEMRQLLSHSALDRLDSYFDQADTLALGAAWADIHTYLPDDLLVKVDVASMANGLEVRAPLLDHKLMEWAAGIPEDLRFAGTETKSLFKKAMEPYLPRELMYRPKMGFGVPIDVWLRREMKEFAYETLLSSKAIARELFDPSTVRALLDRHSSGENWATRIWALLMLELWFKMWIDPVDPFEADVPQIIMSRYAGDAGKIAEGSVSVS